MCQLKHGHIIFFVIEIIKNLTPSTIKDVFHKFLKYKNIVCINFQRRTNFNFILKYGDKEHTEPYKEYCLNYSPHSCPFHIQWQYCQFITTSLLSRNHMLYVHSYLRKQYTKIK